MVDVTPPGYETFREARSRAWSLWSHDGSGKLLGLLVTGQLQACRADEAGSVVPVQKDYWESKDGARLCTARNSEIYEMRGLPVFLKTDLQREIPDMQERMAKSAAEKRERRQYAGAQATITSQPADLERNNTIKSRKGRPPKEGVDGFWIEACRCIIDNERGKTQKDFTAKMKEWSELALCRRYGDRQNREIVEALEAE
jgi:hypothetical protein